MGFFRNDLPFRWWKISEFFDSLDDKVVKKGFFDNLDDKEYAMKRFFQKNGIMMLAAVVVVAVGLCIASAVSNQTGFLQNAAGVVTYPFRAAGSAVAGWFQDIGQRFETVESLRQEIEELRTLIDEAEDEVRS